MMRRAIVTLAVLTLLSGCGSLSRPMPAANRDLAVPRPFQAVSVPPVPGVPGLAEAVVAALDQEDIAATIVPEKGHFMHMLGAIEGQGAGRRLVWRLTGSDDSALGGFEQTISDPPVIADLARAAARSASSLLRSDDQGGSDLAARPRVAVDLVTVSGILDPALLQRSLIAALEQRGIAVVAQDAQFHVIGTVRITSGLAEHDLVEVTWVVHDAGGGEVGKVNQGSPTMRDDLVSRAAQTTHQIAEGGAEGIQQLVMLKK